MQMYFKATPAGEYVINDWGVENASQYWPNKEALELLEAIVKQEVPDKFDLGLLNSLIDRGFVEFSITINLISNNLSNELFEAFTNPNF